MPLESLGQPFNPDEPGRKLREVQVEHEPTEVSRAREYFDMLKQLPIFNSDGAWSLGITDNVVRGWTRTTQNLASACEGVFGNTLNGTDRKIIEKTLQDSDAEFLDQDVGYALLAKFWYDPELARNKFSQIIKQMKVNKRDSGWEDFITESLVIYTGLLLADDRAKQMAKKLKKPKMNNVEDFLNFILVETELDPASARKYWQDLKKTYPYYDAESGLFYGDDEKSLLLTKFQLLAVLIEARLEAKGVMSAPLTSPTQIPEERNF